MTYFSSRPQTCTHRDLYRLADFTFELAQPPLPVPAHFRIFQVQTGAPDYRFTLETAESLSWDRTDFQVRKDQLSIAIEDGLETRYLCLPGSDRPYAVSRELDEGHSLVTVSRADLDLLRFDTLFCSLLSLERRLHHRGCYVLHSAFTVYKGEAILFTAPSGVGKSTQAGLWEQYQGAQVINGDRSLLQFREGQLYASGWPVCGSSGVCRNESYPVRAIVLLQQARENRVDRLSEKEYTLRLMREITINYHDPGFFDGALAFIARLIGGTELVQLSCDISPQAVECLHRALYGGAAL